MNTPALDLKDATKLLAAMSPDVVAVARGTIGLEGGYWDDPSGGPTQFGVCLKHALTLGRTWDLNGDDVVNVDDIKLVTADEAALDAIVEYLQEPGFDQLLAGMQPAVLDESYNAGPTESAKLLQATINQMRKKSLLLRMSTRVLTCDGQCGPVTQKAANLVVNQLGSDVFNTLFAAQRIAYYRACAAAKPLEAKDLNGWINRANSFLPKARKAAA